MRRVVTVILLVCLCGCTNVAWKLEASAEQRVRTVPREIHEAEMRRSKAALLTATQENVELLQRLLAGDDVQLDAPGDEP